jgi:hypothetical protein
MIVFTPGGRCPPSHTELKHRCDKLQRLLKAKDAVIEDYSTKRRVSQQNRLARMSSPSRFLLSASPLTALLCDHSLTDRAITPPLVNSGQI